MKKIQPFILILLFLATIWYFILQNKPNVSLETFTEIPPQIDGFSCFIFSSKEDMLAKKYLGAGDDSYNFFLLVNGELAEFLKKDGVLSTDKYELELMQLNTGVIGYEYYEIQGKITISDKRRTIYTSKDFVGYCAW